MATSYEPRGPLLPEFSGTPGWRGTVRVKSLAQEHNKVTRLGLEPGPLDPESSANHKATASPT